MILVERDMLRKYVNPGIYLGPSDNICANGMNIHFLTLRKNFLTLSTFCFIGSEAGIDATFGNTERRVSIHKEAQ